MAASLLHADKVQPGRCFGSKFHTCDESRAGRWHVSAGHLRGYGEEEFVDAAIGHEFTEEGGAAFMEKQRHAKLSTQKFENGRRRNAGTFEQPNLRGDQRSRTAGCEELSAGLGSDNQSPDAWCTENCSREVHPAASTNHHVERRSLLLEDLRSVARVKVAGFRVHPVGNE